MLDELRDGYCDHGKKNSLKAILFVGLGVGFFGAHAFDKIGPYVLNTQLLRSLSQL